MDLHTIEIKNCSVQKLNGVYLRDTTRAKHIEVAIYIKDASHQIYRFNGVWRIGHIGVKIYFIFDACQNRDWIYDVIDFKGDCVSPELIQSPMKSQVKSSTNTSENRDIKPIAKPMAKSERQIEPVKSVDVVNSLKKLKILFPSENILEYNYSPNLGIYPSNINMYTEYIHDRAKVFFSIVDRFNLEYAVFAGQSVGMVRNGRNPQWVDDYDMIIFRESIELFEKTIVPVLEKNNFHCFKPNEIQINGGFHVLSHKFSDNDKYFQIDLFYSYFDDKGIIRNTHNWGRYHASDIPKSVVMPFTRRRFHSDLNIPFFNNVEEEVRLSYGDVLNDCVIFSHSIENQCVTYKGWELANADFYAIQNAAIENTKRTIYVNKNYKPEKKLNVLKDSTEFGSEIDILKYISKNDVGTIYIFNEIFLQNYSSTIRYYYPTIRMEYFEYVCNYNIIPYLNYINQLNVMNDDIAAYYNNYDIVYTKKPTIEITKLITFGTFDLFHNGHENIFKRCAEYSEHIIVGISTDQFTFEKKNIYPTDSYEKRCENVLQQQGVRIVFPEESMELKQLYISRYKPKIFVMGDDWEGKFDWVNCCVIYFKRTEGISSTLLRNS